MTWTASTGGSVARVEFYIDGSLKWTEHIEPYVYDGDGGKLDTTSVRNGKHTLVVKAFGTDGSTATPPDIDCATSSPLTYDATNNGFNFDGYSPELMWTVPVGCVEK